MFIGSRSVSRFLIERLLPAISGGYTSYSDQPSTVFWIHTLLYLWLFIVPILFSVVSKGYIMISFIHTGITAGLFFIIKIFTYYFNKKFDKPDIQVNTEETFAETLATHEDNPPPFGISPDIWRIRDQITDFHNIDVNTTVDALIQQGYNATDLFHFFDIYQRGLINTRPAEIVHKSHRPTVPTTIKCFCFTFIITWTRQDLEKYFDRPLNIIECFLSPALAFLIGILAFYSVNYVSFSENITLFLCSASAQFSLLKAPNPDSSSTIHQDPLTPFSRGYHLILFQIFFAICSYLIDNPRIQNIVITFFEIEVQFTLVISIIKTVLRLIFFAFPFMSGLGLFGSLRVSLFSLLEIFQIIFFGVSGSVSFPSSAISLFISLSVLIGLTAAHCYVHNRIFRYFIITITYIFGCVLSTFPYVPFISKYLGEKRDYVTPKAKSIFHRFGKSLLHSFLTSCIVFLVMLLPFSTDELFFSISLWIFIGTGIVHHLLIPELMSRYPFNIWSAPFFKNSLNIQNYLRIIQIIEYSFLLPIILASIFRISDGNYFGFNQLFESLLFISMAIYITVMSRRQILRFCIVLGLIFMESDDLGFVLFHTYFYLLVIWKLREALNKLQYVISYSSLHSVTSKMHLICLIFMYANIQFTFFSVVMSMILTSPLIPLFGSSAFISSYTRPTAFWTYGENDEDSPGDSSFYRVINQSLGESFASMSRSGYFPAIVENDFYLICDDYFNAIIHIISSGHDFLVFQLRGLAIQDQTLCHRNELNVIRNGLENLEDQRVFLLSSIVTKFTAVFYKMVDLIFASFGLPTVIPSNQMAVARASLWRTWQDDLPLSSYSVCSNDVGQIFPDKHSQFRIYINLVRVLTVILDNDGNIPIPHDFTFFPDDELLDEWIFFHNKSHAAPIILAVSKLLFDAMMMFDENIAASFGWKLYKYFEGKNMNLHSFEWIPATMEPKLLFAFRIALSLAIEDVAGLLPDSSIDELSSYVSDRIHDCHIMPESDPHWTMLIENRESRLETLRLFNDESGLVVKYMTFTYCEKPFKIIKLNDEMVRGTWAEQIVETIFMESDDRERGSVQFDMFTLRNIISQSANPPIGYPEVICPITFSYA